LGDLLDDGLGQHLWFVMEVVTGQLVTKTAGAISIAGVENASLTLGFAVIGRSWFLLVISFRRQSEGAQSDHERYEKYPLHIVICFERNNQLMSVRLRARFL